MSHQNRSSTPKLWDIAHKNIHKTLKWRVFWHGSKICTDCEWPCKSLQILKSVGNSSQKGNKTCKWWVLVMTPKIQPTITCLVNRTGTLKFWAIAHENRYRMAND
jgi:hypothetical protein